MKRRSSTSAPPEYVFFTDRDLGRRIIPTILREAGINVERHDDHFSESTPDEEWLPIVGSRGWIALTHNSRIRYTPLQVETLMRARVRCFVLVGHAPHSELASNFVACLPKVLRFLGKHADPFLAKVYRSPRRVEMWLSYNDWST